MGIFSSIKQAIFGKDDKAEKKPINPGLASPTAQPGGNVVGATTQVDVEKRLDAMAGADKLNWRTSIVDLLKLIGVDASFENRKELANELGDTNYSGTANENNWLHRRTMKELSQNGGKVPAEFLD